MSSTTGAMSGPEPGATPASVAGPGDATNDAVPRRTWTSSARIDSATSSAVSAPRSSPAGARRAASRSVGHARLVAQPRPDDGGAGRRRDEPDVGRVAGERRGQRLLVPDALGGDDDRRARCRDRAPRCRCRPRPVRRPGRRRGRRSDRRSSTRQPAAEPRLTSAAAIGVVPATHRIGAGRCGST